MYIASQNVNIFLKIFNFFLALKKTKKIERKSLDKHV